MMPVSYLRRRSRPLGPAVLTSTAAIAAALVSQGAHAQSASGPAAYSYNAPDPTVASGSVTISRGIVAGEETYTVNTPTAVLDFVPSDTATGGGAINFQNANTTVTYTNGANVQDFTILNRIVPTDTTRAIQFNGNVVSQIQSVAAGAVTGGTVWFYSPGGIIIGATSTFDVGSLLLTTGDPSISGGIASTSYFTLSSASGVGITVESGASIKALQAGSYIAMVAPYVRQGGLVEVNGSAAYVAAESTYISINQGLFDIFVDVGSDANGGVPIEHTGSTTGPASTGAADPHRIYMVAVPKNNAITMLVAPTGNLGFDVATQVGVENGRIILSAGHDVSGDTVYDTPAIYPAVDASIAIDGGHFTSSVTGKAITDILAESTTRTPTFDGDLSLYARRVRVGARIGGDTLAIGGNLILSADALDDQDQSDSIAAPTDALGGEATLYADTGARLTVAGYARVTADALPPVSSFQQVAADGTGGSATITASGGSIDIAGDATVSASATGNSYAVNGAPGGILTGGDALLSTSGAGDLHIGGAATVVASATGTAAGVGTSGVAYAGTATVSTGTGGGAGIAIDGSLTIKASARGGDAVVDGGEGGSGTGNIAALISGGDTIEVGSLTIDANGIGGSGTVANSRGGAGEGGTARLAVDAGGSVILHGLAALTAYGAAGDNYGDGLGSAADGTGGRALIEVNGSLTAPNDVSMDARGLGGGVRGGFGLAGSGFGGQVRVRGAGTMTIPGLDATAAGIGGAIDASASGNGGDGFGGGVQLIANGASANLTITGITALDVGGTGGAGRGGSGGRGVAGSGTPANDYLLGISVLGNAGTLALTTVQLNARGAGGAGTTGGRADGGSIVMRATDGTIGAGTGVDAYADATGGDATPTGANGPSLAGGSGGDATGGRIEITTVPGTTPNGTVTLGVTTLNVAAHGGVGGSSAAGNGGDGGSATGGGIVAVAYASSGALTVNGLTADGSGTGGAGGDGGGAGGAGGAGTAGTMQFGTESGSDLPANTASASFGAVSLDLRGRGGQGGGGTIAGIGGDGHGGTMTLDSSGTAVTAGDITVNLQGYAGAGSTPGAGFGGNAIIRALLRDQRTESGHIQAGAVSIDASGVGAGGSADGTGGTLTFEATGSDVALRRLHFSGDGSVAGTDPAVSIDISSATVDVTPTGPVDGDVLITTPGNVVLNVHEGGTLTTRSASMTIGSSLLAVPGTQVPGAPGEIRAVDGFAVDVGGNYTLDANLTLTNADLSIIANAVQTENLTVTGRIDVFGTGVTLGDVLARDDVNVVILQSSGGPTANPSGGNLVGGSIDSQTGSVLLTNDYGGITSGDIRAGDRISLFDDSGVTTGDLTAALAGTGAQTGLIELDSLNGPIRTGDIAGVDIEIFQGDLTIPSQPAAISLGAISSESVLIRGLDTITTGDITTADFYPTLTSTQGQDIVIGALGDIQVGNVDAQQFAVFGSRTGSVTGGNMTVQASLAILAAQNVTIGSVATGTGAQDTLFISNSSVLTSDPRLQPFANFEANVPFDQSLLLDVTPARLNGALAINGAVTTGNFRAAAASLAMDGASASQHVELDIASLASFAGLVTAPRIDLGSGDIDIGAGGGLGDATTQQLNLSSYGQQALILGGDGSGTGYRLSNAEAGRLHAQQITISAPGDITVRTLSLTGSADTVPNLIGANAALQLDAQGTIRVEGAFQLASAGTNDRVALNAGTRIEVATDLGGAITITPANGPLSQHSQGPGSSLAGVLSLTAPVIGVGESSLLSQLAADPRFAGRNDAFSTPAANTNPAGAIQAGQLALSASNVIAIQNSGTNDLFGGFTAGDGGMQVTALSNPVGISATAVSNSASTSPVDVWIYGQVAGSSAFIVNGDVRDAITFSPGQAGFSATSGVNGCLLVAQSCAPPVQPGSDQPPEIAAQLNGLIDNVLQSDPQQAAAPPGIRIETFIDQSDLGSNTIVTEPVTGEGNEGLWGHGAQGKQEGDQ